MHHFSFRRIFIGLTAVWLLVLLTALGQLVGGRNLGRAAQRVLIQKRREAGRMVSLTPARAAESTARREDEIKAAGKILTGLQAELAGAGAPARSSGMPGPAHAPAEARNDRGQLVLELRDQARRAGVSIRPEERFGLALADGDSGTPISNSVRRRQHEAAEYLVRTLLDAHPAELMSVQWARSRRSISGGAVPRPPPGAAAGGAGEFFVVDARLSVEEAGVIATVPMRATFVGRTAALRRFLNRLATGRPLVVVDEIAVEPVLAGTCLRRGKSSDVETVVLVVQPAVSKFVVTVEYCSFVAPPGENLLVPAATALAGNETVCRAWSEPTLQKRGRGWVYEIFTPPALFYDRRSHAVAAVPADEAVPADAEAPSLDLQLVQVRKRPFRLRLAGFAGTPDDRRGIFADTTTGKAMIGRVGELLAGRPLRLKHLDVERAVAGAGGGGEPLATAIIADEETGENVVLTTRGPSPAGAAVGLFASRKNPAARRELEEGESASLEGVRYRVERVEMDPPLAVVTCESPDCAKAPGQTLTARLMPDARRGNPAVTADARMSPDSPTTP